MKSKWMLALLALVATNVAAAPAVVVDAVQYPAWLERGGQAVPLTPGTVLQANDRLRTGANARVEMKLSEGSIVKLGEKARFVVERAEDRGVFRAALRMIAGAFRFTTHGSSSRSRDVSIKVKNVTAGVRGTDLWGKSTDERDLVCLLEGKISVGAEGHPRVVLDQPLDFYQKPRDGQPSVAKVDPKQIEEWAREPEMAADGAVGRGGGSWRVIAARMHPRDDALRLVRELRSAGYPAEVAPGSEGWSYQVQVSGLASEAGARSVIENLRQFPDVKLPAAVEVSRIGR